MKTKNKKAKIGIKEILIIMGVIGFLSLMLLLLIFNTEKIEACVELGKSLGLKFEKDYWSYNEIEFCKTTWGDVVYVKIECDGFFNPECSARMIRVGQVWWWQDKQEGG